MAKESKYGRVVTERGTIPEDEPIFILRAQDELAAQTIRTYAALREAIHDHKGAEACRAIADKFMAWPVKKRPD